MVYLSESPTFKRERTAPTEPLLAALHFHVSHAPSRPLALFTEEHADDDGSSSSEPRGAAVSIATVLHELSVMQ